MSIFGTQIRVTAPNSGHATLYFYSGIRCVCCKPREMLSIEFGDK